MQANTHTHDSDRWLIFRIGRVACAIPALVTETILLPPAHLTAAPGSDASHPGMFHHGTETIAAVDLRHRFGIDAPDRSHGRLLLTRVAGRGYGLWVDEIVGLADSGQMTPAPLPPELPRNVFTQALLHRKEIVLCSDPARLLAMHDAGALRQWVQPVPPEPVGAPAEPATAPHPGTPLGAAPAREVKQLKPVPETPGTPPLPSRTAAPMRERPARTASMPRPQPTAAGAAVTEKTPRPPHRREPPPHREPPAAPPPPHARPSPAQPAAFTPEPPPSVPLPPPEEPSRESGTPRLAAMVLLLVLLGAGLWFGIDRWSIPLPAPSVTPPPPTTAAAPSSAPSAPTAAVKPAATVIASGKGVEVERDGHEITIVIDRAKATDSAPPPAARTSPAPPKPPAPPPAPKVYVHTVVKGDTLWAIAERYLDDPWRYKDLAKLSHIKDPDLIYPGDRVRIVIH